MENEKAFISICNVCMMNKELKGFKYNKEKVNIPELKFDTEFTINIMDLVNVLDYFKKCGDDSIKLEKISNIKTIYIGYHKDNCVCVDIKIPIIKDFKENDDTVIKSNYSVEYLRDFFKSFGVKELKNIETCKLSFGNDYPMKIELNNGVFLIIAPRVSMD